VTFGIYTVCSNMNCYNKAELTGDPADPPFCPICKAKGLVKKGKER